MAEIELLRELGITTETCDVVFCSHGEPCTKVQDELNARGLVWRMVDPDGLTELVNVENSPRTVVLDTNGMNRAQTEKLSLLVKRLENIGVASVFLNNHIGCSFDQFELTVLAERCSVAELIGRIESNITYSRKLREMQTQPHPTIVDETIEERAEQLQMAGQVQRDFLPARLPHSEHIRWATLFEPADCVSGDIYDVRRLDEQNIGFYLADAVGHSMPAALLTMFLKQAIVMRETKGHDYRIFSPLEVIHHLNERMTEQQLTGCLFATCCYGLINMRTLQLSYCRAGHPYPILKKAGREPQILGGKGGLLGVFENGEFSQELVQLSKGDKLFIYSDGAEPLLGKVDDDGQLELSSEFKEIMKLGVDDLIGEFDSLRMANLKTGFEKDDVTVIAAEIL